MSTIESSSADDHAALPKPPSALYSHPNPPKLDGSLRTEKPALSTWTDRLKSYFLTNEGRIALASLIFTLTCVVLQHVMGTCDHAFGNADAIVKWHVFTPPCWLMIFLHGGYECSPLNFLVGAGPHTAVFFLVLSWVTLAYCIDRLWIHVTTGARVSKKRDLIVHGVIVALFLAAFGFNIWGSRKIRIFYCLKFSAFRLRSLWKSKSSDYLG